MLIPLIVFYFALLGVFSFGLAHSDAPTSKVSVQANVTADFFLKYKDAALAYCELNKDWCSRDSVWLTQEQLSPFFSKAVRNTRVIESNIISCKYLGNIFMFSLPPSNVIPSDFSYQKEIASNLMRKIGQRDEIIYIGSNSGFSGVSYRCGVSLSPHHTILVVR